MPNSNESSESEFSNENQQNIINRNSNSLSKKNRHHQNYSKNIYIGTKNAEKWDNIRTNLSFKNDVEFVTYLLELSEQEQLRKNGLVTVEKNPCDLLLRCVFYFFFKFYLNIELFFS